MCTRPFSPSTMSPSTDSAQQAQVSALCLKEGNIMPKEPRLPSYEEVVGKVDSTCLPSYRESRQPRYHPYARPFARPVKPDEERFFNTIYDDERIELIVPPARGRRGFRPLIPPLVPTPLIANAIRHVRIEREADHDEVLRRHHIGALILQEFVAAWPHCGARPA